jgi:hypothetical protein
MNETVNASVDWVVMALLLAWLILSLCIAELVIESRKSVRRRIQARQARKSIEHHQAKLRAVKKL